MHPRFARKVPRPRSPAKRPRGVLLALAGIVPLILLAGCPGPARPGAAGGADPGGAGASGAPAAPTASARSPGVGPAMEVRAPEARTQTVLAIAGATLGWIEPCGCSEGMLGGVARRAAWVERRRAAGDDVVLLDTGDLVREPGPQSDLKLLALEQVHRRLGTAAIALSTRDLVYRQRIAGWGLPTLLPGSAPLTLRFRDGVTLSAAVVAGRETRGAYEREGLLPPEGPPPAADVIVHIGTREDARALWGAAGPGRAPLVIVSGRDEELPAAPERLGSGAWLVSSGDKGKYALPFAVEREPGAARPSLRPLAAVALGERIPDAPWAAALVDEYKQQLFAANLGERGEHRPLESGGTFMGAETCGACHPRAFAAWRNMKHSHAFESLVPRKGTRDPECLRCHATGAGYESGFRSIESTPELGAVTCESCHGVGGNHVKAMTSGDPAALAGAVDFGRIRDRRRLCVECHDPENSPRFDADAYWAKIRHGKEASMAAPGWEEGGKR